MGMLLSLSKLSVRKNQSNICKFIMTELEDEISKLKQSSQSSNPSLKASLDYFYLNRLEAKFSLGEISENEISSDINKYFANNIDPDLKAMYLSKLGSWLSRADYENREPNYNQVLKIYDESQALNCKVILYFLLTQKLATKNMAFIRLDQLQSSQKIY